MFSKFFKFISVVFLLAVFGFSQNSFAQLTGTKTIPGDYATISAAVTDLNTVGVGAGGVTFNVAAGYTESITVPILLTATGTSGNPVVFQKSGGGANPLVTRTDVGTITTSTLGGDGDAVFKLNGTDYITFNGIDVAASDQGIEYGYYTSKPSGTDGCQFVTISNCVLTMTKGTSAFVTGIYISNGSVSGSSAVGVTVTGPTGMNSGVTIKGNTVQNVFAGILVRGSTAYYDSVITIGQSGAGNIIQNYGASSAASTYAVYFIYVENPSVAYNTINNAGGGGAAHTSTLYGVFYSIVSGIVVGSNNAITLGNASASSATYCMYNGNTCTSEDFNINTFSIGTMSSTGALYLIYASNSTPIVNVMNNVTGGTITRTAAGTTYGYYNFGSPSGGTATISNNNFSNFTLTGASSFYGIDHRTTTTQVELITNNTISNVVLGTSAGYGIYQGYGAAGSTVNGNNVYGFSGAGSMYGFYLGASSAPLGLTAYNNNAYNLLSTGTLVVGFYNSLGTANNIYKNSVYNLEANNAAGIVYGMQVAGGVGTYVFNNFISDLRAPITSNVDAIRAINITSTTATSTIGVYYNSIYLNATSSGAIFGTTGIYHTYSATATTAVLDMRDNVIVNNSTPNSTGFTVAFRRSAATSLVNFGSTSNNNDFYAGTPDASHLIFYDGTNSDQTIDAYKIRVAPRCSAAFSENPPFLNVSTTPYNLHMNTGVATQTESGGTTVSTPVAVTDDFDGNTRNVTTPDVGADEFTGIALDLTPPIISYSPLLNTSSTSGRTLTASITDPSGVPTAGIGLPRLFWRINGGAYTAVTGAFVSGSNYNFTFGTGVITGDLVEYYVVAQDGATSPNVTSFPFAGAGGFTANPPTAATPPTTPSSYTITNTALAGNYTVGLLLFNQVTGLNIYFDKVVTKIIKEVEVEVPVVQNEVEKGKKSQLTDVQALFKTQTIKKLMEVEDISWVPMQNGQPYVGDLFVKKGEHPEYNYPLGTDGIYTTITAAVADLNLRGVSAAVNFLLNDASYTAGETYPIVVNVTNVSQPTSVNKVTIKPNTGVTSLIQGASASSQIFKILTSYVNIDGSNSGSTDRSLTIENTSATAPNVVVFGSTGTTPITGCSLKNTICINGSNTSSAVIVSDAATPGNPGYFMNITIQNNSIQKAYIGAYCNAVIATGNGNGLLLTGNDLNTSGANSLRLIGLYAQGIDGATVSNNNIGNFTTLDAANITGVWFATGTINSTISNNTIGPIASTTGAPRGIVVTSALTNSNVTVSGNIVSGITSSYSSAPYGIWVFSTTTGVIIEKNKVSGIYNTNTGGYGARGIHVSTGVASTDVTIRNNFVSDIQATSDVSSTYWGIGIGIEGATTGVNVYFNNVNLYGTMVGYTSGTLSAAFAVITSTAASLDIRDNIFVNTFDNTNSALDKAYAINSQAPNTAFTNINYNDYYVEGIPGVLGYLGADQTTLAAWQTATGKDANSINGDPHYASNVDLHINTSYNTVSNNGQYIASVPTDIDGNARNVTTPDIGADEYTYVPPAVLDPSGVSATPINSSQIDVAFTPNASSNNVVIVFNQTGTFTPPSGPPPAIGDPFAGGTLLNVTITSPYSHTGLSATTQYFYKLFSYNGTAYSTGVEVNATTPCGVVTAPWTEDFEHTGTFPPPCWTLAGTATTLWVNGVTSGYGTGTYSAKADFYGVSSGSRELISFEYDASAMAAQAIRFDWAYATYSGEVDEMDIYYSTDTGTSWNLLLAMPGGSNGILNPFGIVQTASFTPTAAQWSTLTLTLPSNANMVKFTAITAFGNNLYLDNVKLVEPLANDVGTTSIDVAGALPTGTVAPKATVKNFGSATNTFNVQMTITGGYSSTKTVTGLVAGASQQVTFDNWNATVGSYTVDVCTQLGTDGDPSNNCLTLDVGVYSGSWANGATVSLPRVYGGAASYIQTTLDVTTGYLFVAGGIDSAQTNTEAELDRYNVNTNTWTSMAPMPAGRDRLTATTVGNFVYALGGYDVTSGLQVSTVYKYDIAGNSWTTVASLPVASGWGGAVGYNNNYIYYAGGYSGAYESAVYLYNVTSNTWTAATSMPGGVFGGAFAITGNKLVYVGGANASGISNAVFVGTIDGTDPSIITWTAAANYPGVEKEVQTLFNGNLADLAIGKYGKKDPGQMSVYPAGGMFRFSGATWGTDGIIVATGSSSGFPPADPSPTYVYKPGTDTWARQADVPIPVIGTQLGTVNDGNTWKLIVAWGDASAGFIYPTHATQIYTDNLGGGTTTFDFNLTVANGWNMVSVPGTNPAGMLVGNWWSHLTGTVYKFVPGSGYAGVTTTAPSEGYWLKNNQNETYNYTGIVVAAHNPIAATAGWNMIGGFEDVVDVNTLTTNTGNIVYPIYKFNPGAGYATATTLNPGVGYWVKVSANCQITIPDVLAKSVNGEVVEYFKEDWGKIQITDASGSHYTLYAVNGEVDLNNYELPPLPPAGNFDIRFGSGRIAEDINSSMQTIDMSGVTYPLTVSVEGMDIRLTDVTGKVISASLKSGESVTISDSRIEKLMVSGETIPTVYALEQNYPNPFNPSTVIEFSLPEDVSNVKLSVYNALGEKVAELVNSSLAAGRYSYQWNAKNVATGMYIYELRTDKFVSVKKMLLLK